MNVSLSPELVKQMDECVASGEFKSRDDILRVAVAIFLNSAVLRKQVKELNALVAEGEADLAAGRYVTVSSDKELKELFDSL